MQKFGDTFRQQSHLERKSKNEIKFKLQRLKYNHVCNLEKQFKADGFACWVCIPERTKDTRKKEKELEEEEAPSYQNMSIKKITNS